MAESLWTDATVTGLDPLRVQLDGDTEPLPFTPDSLVDPSSLLVSDRVRCEVSQQRIIVVGRAGGLLPASPPAWDSVTGKPLLSSRNRIINGAFQINQREYASGASLASGVYGFDRWKSNAAGTTLTFTAAPQGQMITVNSGHGLQQILPREDMPADDYVLSWPGTMTGRVYNEGDTPPAYAASPVQVSLDGSAKVVAEFTASGGSRTLGEVQLEAGTTPTPFERELYEAVLAQCQRFYQRIDLAQNGPLGMGSQLNNASARVAVRFIPKMRVTPTLSSGGALTWTDEVFYSPALTGISMDRATDSAASLLVTFAANGTERVPGNIRGGSGGGWIAFSAEI